jgi:hypothetical protein
MSTKGPILIGLAVLGGMSALSPEGNTALIQGRVEFPTRQVDASSKLGFAQTQVLPASPAYTERPEALVLFLHSLDSHPISEEQPAQELTLRGFALEPSLIACAIDGVVRLHNRTRGAVTVTVANALVGKIPADGSIDYVCRPSRNVSEFRSVRILENPYAKADIYAGPLGLAARPEADGSFVLDAPKGTFSLEVVSAQGVLVRRKIKVNRATVKVGLLLTADGRPVDEPTADEVDREKDVSYRGLEPVKQAPIADAPEPRPAPVKPVPNEDEGSQ